MSIEAALTVVEIFVCVESPCLQWDLHSCGRSITNLVPEMCSPKLLNISSKEARLCSITSFVINSRSFEHVELGAKQRFR